MPKVGQNAYTERQQWYPALAAELYEVRTLLGLSDTCSRTADHDELPCEMPAVGRTSSHIDMFPISAYVRITSACLQQSTC